MDKKKELKHRVLQFGKIELVEIPGILEKKPERKMVEVPKVNPRVTPEEAIKALERSPGGKEAIELLRKKGKKI